MSDNGRSGMASDKEHHDPQRQRGARPNAELFAHVTPDPKRPNRDQQGPELGDSVVGRFHWVTQSWGPSTRDPDAPCGLCSARASRTEMIGAARVGKYNAIRGKDPNK